MLQKYIRIAVNVLMAVKNTHGHTHTHTHTHTDTHTVNGAKSCKSGISLQQKVLQTSLQEKRQTHCERRNKLFVGKIRKFCKYIPLCLPNIFTAENIKKDLKIAVNAFGALKKNTSENRKM